MAISKDKTRILVTIPKDLKKQLEGKAKAQNRSLSNYILNLLEKDANKDNPT